MSLYINSDRKPELIAMLKDRLRLSDISDEEVLLITKGTFLFATTELNMASSEFWKELKCIIRFLKVG